MKKKKSYAIELAEEAVGLIKAEYGKKNDRGVRAVLQDLIDTAVAMIKEKRK